MTLISCQLETGRTHQILAHLKNIGHHFFMMSVMVVIWFQKELRQYQFTKTLGFVHPTTGEMMRFDTELPQDLQDCIEKWRGYSNLTTDVAKNKKIWKAPKVRYYLGLFYTDILQNFTLIKYRFKI
jgi:hypothetical protein